MTLLNDVVAELTGMFLGDARLSAAILSVVAGAAGLIHAANLPPLAGGGLLLVGCLGVLILAVLRSARRPSGPKPPEMKT
ncbi:MAG: hypothetical protein JXR75_01880 [Rhodobacteraceae bacterium]|nr:hypothetical protein [Paracoccaceae bacterium]